jgi:hypothetical protein
MNHVAQNQKNGLISVSYNNHHRKIKNAVDGTGEHHLK